MPTGDRWAVPADPDLEQIARTAMAEWNLDQPRVIAFDSETRGLNFHDPAFGFSVAWVHNDELTGRNEVRGHWFDTDRVPRCADALRAIFTHAQVIVGHHLRFDLHRAQLAGVFPEAWWGSKEFHDTQAMSHLDDEHRSHGLKQLAVSVLGFDDTMDVPGKQKNKETGLMEPVIRKVPRSKWEVEQAKLYVKKQLGLASVEDVGYDLLPRGTLVPYAILDAVWTLELARILHPRILAYPDLTELYEREMLLSRGAVYAMEKAGMKVDVAYVEAEAKVYRKKVMQHELDIEAIVGKPVRSGKMSEKEKPLYFNPASPKQVGEYFTARGFPSDSYDEDALRGIHHPLAAKLLEYRGDKKILDGYLISLLRETGPDGLFHLSSRQHGTVSGRSSAGAERGDQ